MLTIQTGQLMVRGLAPLRYDSLVGYSIRIHPRHSWFAYSLASLSRHLRMCRFYQAGRLDAREGRQVSRAPLPNSGVTSVGET